MVPVVVASLFALMVLPLASAARQAAVSTISVDAAERARMDRHRQRYESMSDREKERIRKQMRRVRPLSIEERADAAQRDP